MIFFRFGKDPVSALYSRVARRHKTGVMLYLLLLLLSVGLQLPVPYLVSDIIDGLSGVVEVADVRLKILYIVVLSVLGLWTATLGEVYNATLNKRFNLDLRLAVFKELQQVPYSFNRKYNISDLLARFTGDVGALNHLLPTGLAKVIRHCIFVVVFGGALIYTNSTIALYIFGFLPLTAFIFKAFSKRMSELSKDAREGYAEANGAINESLVSLRESRIVGTQEFYFQKLKGSLIQSETKLFSVRRYNALMVGVLGLIPILATAMIWFVGGVKVDAGEMTVGQLISIMVILSMLYSPLSALFEAAAGYVYELVSFRRIADIINGQLEAGTETSGNSVLREEDAPYSLKLQDVAFSYHTDPVLQGFNALMPAGECTVLAGPNGAGKSTLISLVTGLEHPLSGGVYIDNMSLKLLSPAFRARHFGYVPQDTFIFRGSLRLNIAVGRPISDQRITDTLKELGWQKFMDDWDEQLDTEMQEGGRNLSGGQKQKIAILRALVNQPSLLVLDEPDNNLEEDSLNKLVGYLKRLKGRCTVVLVTHSGSFEHITDSTLELSTELGNEC